MEKENWDRIRLFKGERNEVDFQETIPVLYGENEVRKAVCAFRMSACDTLLAVFLLGLSFILL
jgi:predicted phage tail protein